MRRCARLTTSALARGPADEAGFQRLHAAAWPYVEDRPGKFGFVAQRSGAELTLQVRFGDLRERPPARRPAAALRATLANT